MSQTQSSPKLHVRRVLTTLVALGVVLAPLAFAADQTIDTTVAAVNTLSLNPGGTVALAPSVGVDAEDSTTVLAFDTNDGSTYKITVVAAAGWAFLPAVTGSVSNTWPVLRFVSATSTAGTPATVADVLIDGLNAVQTAVDVVTAITSAKGTATVTLDASVTQTVVAGAYSTTLTYALVNP